MNGYAGRVIMVHGDARRVWARDSPGLIRGGLKARRPVHLVISVSSH